MRAIIAMATTARTHVHQQCHHNKGNNASSITRDKGDNASLTMVETRLCINNGNNAIVMRATITIVTMAKLPVH
jgi:hypothetical protein